MSPAAREIWVSLSRSAVAFASFALFFWLAFHANSWLPIAFDSFGQSLLSFVILIAYFATIVFGWIATRRLADRLGLVEQPGPEDRASQ